MEDSTCMFTLTAYVYLYIYPINKYPNANKAGRLLGGRKQVGRTKTSPTLGDRKADDVSNKSRAVHHPLHVSVQVSSGMMGKRVKGGVRKQKLFTSTGMQ